MASDFVKTLLLLFFLTGSTPKDKQDNITNVRMFRSPAGSSDAFLSY